MGWFDESSEDEDVPNSNTRSSTIIDNKNADQAAAAAEDEIDPLDAYMSGITTTAASDAAQSEASRLDEANDNNDDDPFSSKRRRIGGSSNDKVGRLDMENEEEATAHWKESEVTTSTSVATATAVNEDDWMDGTTSAAADDKAKKRIEPLAPVDHSKITYEPFQRCFLKPTSTDKSNYDVCTDTQSWRDEHNITCQPSTTTQNKPIRTFQDLTTACLPNTITPSLLHTITNQLNFQSPTPVQSQTIPILLAGKDALVTASTGSGKTFAFVLPLVIHCCDQPHIEPGVDGPIGVVLSPTRELANQTYQLLTKLLQPYQGTCVCVTGGSMGKYEMSKLLSKGCEIITSTPGRLIDMVKCKATNLKRVTMMVLDEADRMLEMGFEYQVKSILNNVRPDRQTVMFSATFKTRIAKLAEGWLNYQEVVKVSVGVKGASSEYVSQHVFCLKSIEQKTEWMIGMLPTFAHQGKMIIFVASRVDCERVANIMRNHESIGGKGLRVGSIHGDKDQIDRNAALKAFKRGKSVALVATDVAARGLDVQDVMTVVNFDVAKNMDGHVHRIGRAGRMSADSNRDTDKQVQRRGTAYTLLTPKNADFANSLMESFKREDRPITDELINLASRSKHYHNNRTTATSSKRNRGDDGAHCNNDAQGLKSRSRQPPSKKKLGWGGGQFVSASKNDSYYGPSSSSSKPKF